MTPTPPPPPLTLSSPPKKNSKKKNPQVSSINAFTSIFAGLGVFSILGHLAHTSGVSVDAVVADGLGLAFIAYPAGLSLLPAPQFFCMCFFAMLFCLGVDSEFAMVEVVLTLVKDMKVDIPQERLAAVLCFGGFCCGLIYTTDAGIYWFSWTNDWSATFLLLIVIIGECAAVTLYTPKRFCAEFEMLCKQRIHPMWFKIITKVTLPASCILLIISIGEYVSIIFSLHAVLLETRIIKPTFNRLIPTIFSPFKITYTKFRSHTVFGCVQRK